MDKFNPAKAMSHPLSLRSLVCYGYVFILGVHGIGHLIHKKHRIEVKKELYEMNRFTTDYCLQTLIFSIIGAIFYTVVAGVFITHAV